MMLMEWLNQSAMHVRSFSKATRMLSNWHRGRTILGSFRSYQCVVCSSRKGHWVKIGQVDTSFLSSYRRMTEGIHSVWAKQEVALVQKVWRILGQITSGTLHGGFFGSIGRVKSRMFVILFYRKHTVASEKGRNRGVFGSHSFGFANGRSEVNALFVTLKAGMFACQILFVKAGGTFGKAFHCQGRDVAGRAVGRTLPNHEASDWETSRTGTLEFAVKKLSLAETKSTKQGLNLCDIFIFTQRSLARRNFLLLLIHR